MGWDVKMHAFPGTDYEIERQLQIILQVLWRGAGDIHPTIVVLLAVLLDSAWVTPKKRALMMRVRAANVVMAKRFWVIENKRLGSRLNIGDLLL